MTGKVRHNNQKLLDELFFQDEEKKSTESLSEADKLEIKTLLASNMWKSDADTYSIENEIWLIIVGPLEDSTIMGAVFNRNTGVLGALSPEFSKTLYGRALTKNQ